MKVYVYKSDTMAPPVRNAKKSRKSPPQISRVPKKKRKSPSSRPGKGSGGGVIMVISLIIFAVFIFYSLQYAYIEKSLVEIRQMKKDIEYMESRNSSLQVEVKRLKQVNRIFTQAEKLGLVSYGEVPELLYIPREKIEKAREKDAKK